MEDPISVGRDELRNVQKRQRMCEVATEKAVDALIGRLEEALAAIESGDDPSFTMSVLADGLSDLELGKPAVRETKDYHGAVAKLGKAVEEGFSDAGPLCEAVSGRSADPKLVDRVVLDDLFQEGRFLAAAAFAREAELGDVSELERPFASVRAVLRRIDLGDADAVLRWVEEREGERRLEAASPAPRGAGAGDEEHPEEREEPAPAGGGIAGGRGRSWVAEPPRAPATGAQGADAQASEPTRVLRFAAHRAAFLDILRGERGAEGAAKTGDRRENGGQGASAASPVRGRACRESARAALAYARSHLASFYPAHGEELRELAGSLVFARRGWARGEGGAGAGDAAPAVAVGGAAAAPPYAGRVPAGLPAGTPAGASAGPSPRVEEAATASEAAAAPSPAPRATEMGSGGAAAPDPAARADAAELRYLPLLCPRDGGLGERQELRRLFVKTARALLGRGRESPLLVAVAAGATALPTLSRAAQLAPLPVWDPARDGPGEPSPPGSLDAHQLPVETPLGPELVFHSVFACPVSRDESTPTNPPMALPCGHCMCKLSVAGLAKTPARPFKCPYCPAEATGAAARQITFPEPL